MVRLSEVDKTAQLRAKELMWYSNQKETELHFVLAKKLKLDATVPILKVFFVMAAMVTVRNFQTLFYSFFAKHFASVIE